MKYYFINTANQQEGPIDVHEFASHGVTDQSFVWREGMADWKRAGDCDELKSFFEAPATQIHPAAEEPPAATDCNDGVPAPPCHLTAAITGLVLMTIPIPYVALLGGAALGITEDDIDDISGFGREIAGVGIGVMIRDEQGEGKLSVRTSPEYDASAICTALGGGGHRAAAGATVPGGIAAAKAAVLRVLTDMGVL